MDFAHYTNLVKDFVATYPNWAAAVVFILAFGESLAFVSLVLPFWAMLVAIGAIIGGTNSLNFWAIVAAAASGAALGDWLSYWLGYHYAERIQSMWPLKNHPTLIEKGRDVLPQMGCVGDRSGPLLRPAARQRADRGGNRTDAAAPIPARQLELGVPVGFRAALAGSIGDEVVVRLFLLTCSRRSFATQGKACF